MSKSNKSKYKSFICHTTNHFKSDCPDDEANGSSLIQVAVASYDDGYESVVAPHRRVGSSTWVSHIIRG